jgi:hypothetical protein
MELSFSRWNGRTERLFAWPIIELPAAAAGTNASEYSGTQVDREDGRLERGSTSDLLVVSKPQEYCRCRYRNGFNFATLDGEWRLLPGARVAC